MGKERKLLAIDVDGTMLKSDGSISPRTLFCLSNLSEKGFLIVLSSGRPPRGILPFYKAIGLTTPIIAYNGGQILYPNNDGFESEKITFPKEEVVQIHAKAASFLTSFQAEEEDNIYCESIDSKLDPYFSKEGMKVRAGQIEEILNEDLSSVVFGCAEKDYPSLESIVAPFAPLSLRHWTGMSYSELYYPFANKGTALAKIKTRLGIAKENCFAFGDAINDEPMLLEAGHPFLMKNSKAEELKKKFSLSLSSNDEDGLAITIESLFGS